MPHHMSDALKARLLDLGEELAQLGRRVGRLEDVQRMAAGGPLCDLEDPPRDEYDHTMQPINVSPRDDDSLEPPDGATREAMMRGEERRARAVEPPPVEPEH